jgi:hypothetical protein
MQILRDAAMQPKTLGIPYKKISPFRTQVKRTDMEHRTHGCVFSKVEAGTGPAIRKNRGNVLPVEEKDSKAKLLADGTVSDYRYRRSRK